jgi:hypothetical protein
MFRKTVRDKSIVTPKGKRGTTREREKKWMKKGEMKHNRHQKPVVVLIRKTFAP